MNSLLKHIVAAIFAGLLLTCGQLHAQKIGCPALEDSFKPGILKARSGLAGHDRYDLTDALVNFKDLKVYDDLYIQPLTHGAEKVFSYESISRYFEEENDVMSLAQDAEVARGAAKGDPMAISVTYDLIPAHGRITYRDVANDSGSLAIMVASADGSGICVTVICSDGKKQEIYHEEHGSIAKGKFFGEGVSYTITIENPSDQDETVATALQ